MIIKGLLREWDLLSEEERKGVQLDPAFNAMPKVRPSKEKSVSKIIHGRCAEAE